MQKGQGSTEYLVLLAAALVIALLAVGFLMFSPGTANESRKAESRLYWENAKPLAVLEAQGSSRQAVIYEGATVLVLKNIGLDPITIQGVTINGYTGRVWFGSEKTYDNFGHLNIWPGSCSAGDNSNRACIIRVNQGSTIFVQAQDGQVCSESAPGPVLNSLVQGAETSLKIYYASNGLSSMESGTVNLYVSCSDFFKCSTAGDCASHYGGNPLNFACDSAGGCTWVEV